MFKIEGKNILAGKKKNSWLDIGSLLRLGSYNLKTEYDAIWDINAVVLQRKFISKMIRINVMVELQNLSGVD